MGGSSSKSQRVTQTQKLDPAIAGPAGKLAKGIYNYARQPITFFPGSTVAPFTAEQQSAFDAISRSARTSPLLDQAQQYASDVAGGEYLTGPGWQRSVDAVVDPIMARVNSQFGLAGRAGAPLSQAQILREASPALANLYGQERVLQQQAAGQLPALEAAEFADPQALLTAQSRIQAQRQAEIDEQIARHQFGQDARMDRAMQALAAITGGYAGTGVGQQMTPYNRNPIAGGIGGTMGGLALGGMMGLGGWPLAGVAGLGALGGLLS